MIPIPDDATTIEWWEDYALQSSAAHMVKRYRAARSIDTWVVTHFDVDDIVISTVRMPTDKLAKRLRWDGCHATRDEAFDAAIEGAVAHLASLDVQRVAMTKVLNGLRALKEQA